jgi:seryl-tRNA synthetase
MIDVRALEKNELDKMMNAPYQQGYRESLKARGASDAIVDEILELNKTRKALLTEAESSKAKQNKVSQEIAKLKRSGESAEQLLQEMQALSFQIKEMEKKASDADDKVRENLMVIPNMVHHSVPKGSGAESNKVVRTWGNLKKFSFKPQEHGELGEKLGILDFERAGKVTGARFTFLKGAAARLERALIQFMMDVHADQHGYEEMIPPFMVNRKSLEGTGNFPKFTEDVFWLKTPEYFLIPTAEVPVTNFFAQEILDEKILPKKFVAYSPCFRSEAGNYGRDTKGLIRQHQFNKVELVKFARPEESENEHEKLTQDAEKILQLLELPYQVVALCSGDISFSAMKCYDLEVWLPGQNAFREISSCSNFGDFQARRAGIRYRDANGKPQFVHTINGSGLAVGRTLIAIFENYQNEDGSIEVPKVLQNYMGGLTKIS